ncbi:hypothetical protein ACFLU5_11355 [Bacteroidota bacterium]
MTLSILKINRLILTFFILVFAGCHSRDTTGLNGEWKAEWSMKPSDLTTDILPENLSMTGIFRFFEDNTAQVTANGYTGCLFCSDTLTNKLTWELMDSTLIMKNLDYDFTLEYTIQNRLDKSLELVLMEDITIRLNKN